MHKCAYTEDRMADDGEWDLGKAAANKQHRESASSTG